MNEGQKDGQNGGQNDRDEARLRAVRELLTIDLDRAKVTRLAASLTIRQRGRARRRRVLIGAGATSALALLVLAAQSRRPMELARAPAGPPVAAPIADGLPKVVPAPGRVEYAHPSGGAAAGAARLRDQAADLTEAAEHWAAYVRSPDTSTRLPNVSYAGYRYGARATGRAPAKVVNVKQAPFGAAGDGKTDDTAAIRRAIDSVEGEGGVVYLPDGDYRISGVLFVHGSGTVVRGESQARTRLLFTQTLDESMGPSMAGSFSRWEWAGGLLWFAPRSRQTYRPGTGAAADRPEIWSGSSPDWARRGWPVGAPLAKIVEPASRGDRSLMVADTSRLAPGDLVFLTVPASESLLAAGWFSSTEGGRLVNRRREGPSVVRWPVEITRIQGSMVTLAQPLRFDVPPAMTTGDGPVPILQAIPAGQTIRDVGVEQLTLVMQRQRPWGGTVHLAEPFGWNGPFFLNTVHGFARQVTVVNGDLGMGTVASKNISLEQVDLRSEGLSAGLTPHRALAIRAQSHDVLVQGLSMDKRWVGVRLEGSGFVLSNGRGHFGNMTGQAVDTVLTELTELGEGPPAASGSLTQSGERLIGWNLRRPGLPSEERTTQLAPGVPSNLYEAQRRLRLSR
jgi:hypothetical protein